jgi:VIT family
MQDKNKTLQLVETMTRDCGNSSLTFKSALIWCTLRWSEHGLRPVPQTSILPSGDGKLCAFRGSAMNITGLGIDRLRLKLAIYVARGLDPSLAKQVAQQLMAHDALGAHARDELGISETLRARPIQAALASAGSFAVGAAMPLLVTAMVPAAGLIPLVSGTSLVFLALLGGLAARAGGAGVTAGAIRVTFWGALAMALTAGVGALFGTVAWSGANRRRER